MILRMGFLRCENLFGIKRREIVASSTANIGGSKPPPYGLDGMKRGKGYIFDRLR